MRAVSTFLAVAVLFASTSSSAPSLRVVGSESSTEIDALPTREALPEVSVQTDTPDDDEDAATASATQSEEEDPESDDSNDEVGAKLLAVLPGRLSFIVSRSHPQSWLRTHARPIDDPDPANDHRPPIAA